VGVTGAAVLTVKAFMVAVFVAAVFTTGMISAGGNSGVTVFGLVSSAVIIPDIMGIKHATGPYTAPPFATDRDTSSGR